MFTTPTPDMGSGMLLLIYGTWALICWGLPAFLIEAVILHYLLPTGKWRALLESFLANAITTIVGIITVAVSGPGLYEPLTKLSGKDYYYDAGEHHIQYIMLMAVVTCLISILFEGVVVWAFEKKIPASRIWIVAFVANVISYGIGLPITAVVLFSNIGH